MTGQATPVQMGGQQLTPYVKPPSTVVNVGGEQLAFRKKIEESEGTRISEQMGKIETDANNAVGILANLDFIEENLKNVQTTGPLDTAQIFVNNLANQLGVDVDLAETSSKEEINAASRALSVPLVKQLGVNPTDRDAKIIESTVAGLGKSKQANYDLINISRQIANKKLAHAKIAERLKQEGKERKIGQAIREYDSKNPVKPPKKAKEAPFLPSGKLDISKLQRGQTYLKDGNIYEFDGIGFIQQ